MRHGKPHFFLIFVFFCVICAIYYVASGGKESLGASVPLSLRTNQNTPQVPLAAEVKNTAHEAITGSSNSNLPKDKTQDSAKESTHEVPDSEGEFTETPFMPKMANATLKAQLGNSAWYLLHTVLARYPETPSDQEKATLKLFILMFGQVYPCGDCARHFQKLLKKYPPQVGSRQIAATWGCHIHNKVNERLDKPEYDCSKILEDYDCGCGDDEKSLDFTLGNDSMEHLRNVKVDEKPGLQRGG